MWTHALGEKGNHLRVERVGLAKRPIARAKSRIWRGLLTQSSNQRGQGRRNSGFEAARRLQYNKGDGQSPEADDQVVHPLALSWNTECLARRSEMNVEAIFRYVDADEDGALFRP